MSDDDDSICLTTSSGNYGRWRLSVFNVFPFCLAHWLFYCNSLFPLFSHFFIFFFFVFFSSFFIFFPFGLSGSFFCVANSALFWLLQLFFGYFSSFLAVSALFSKHVYKVIYSIYRFSIITSFPVFNQNLNTLCVIYLSVTHLIIIYIYL